MKRYWNHLVKSTEQTVKRFVTMQIMDPDSPEYGRMPSDVIEGKQTIYLLTDAVCLYCLSDSKYYHSPVLLNHISAALLFVEHWQRPDGSLDFPTCNFYSAPDTGFCFRRLYGAWRILTQSGDNNTERLADRYLKILLKCLPIMLTGGFHTPNHRWAVTSVLSCLRLLVQQFPQAAMEVPHFPIPFESPEALENAITARMDQYLGEGIDGDQDGEYAERSTGGYNAVVDKCLITLYESTKDPEYLGYVTRNLEMMLYYIEPDDSIFTQNSTRQDHGNRMYPDTYFPLYCFMAAQTGNPLFDKAAHKIIRDNQKRGAHAPDCLYLFMMNPKMRAYQFRGYGYLDTYRRFFSGSQVLRVKREDYSYSILNHNPHFLFLHFRKMPIAVKIGTSYCDVRNFVPQKMLLTDTGCTLSARINGWYYQPFEQSPPSSDWWAMDHSKRERINTSDLNTTVEICELERGLDIHVKTEGLDGLPLRVEIRIPSGAALSSDAFYTIAEKGGSMVLRQGTLSVTKGSETILIGPGYGTHTFKGHYSGEEGNANGYTLFLNDYTPYQRSFSIRLKEPDSAEKRL